MSEELPRRWHSPGGNIDLWGAGGTYKEVPYDRLPPLPATTHDGSFAWLLAEPLSKHPLDFGDAVEEEGDALAASVHVRLGRIVASAANLGLTIPPELVRFIDDPTLHRRVPSCTACYLDVPSQLVELPGVPGRLLRFMNDQQVCRLWYVHLLPGGAHSVVSAWPKFDYDRPGETLEDLSTPEDVVTCAPSFEAFIQRFWLENTLWFAHTQRTPLRPEQRAYAEAARKGGA